MTVQFWIIAACAVAVVIAVVIAVITVIAPPRGMPPPPPPVEEESVTDASADTTPIIVDDAPSEITTVVSPDVAQNTNPDEEYTIVPVDSVPLEYEIKHLDLTDRSQGQYIPSWRDSMNAPAMSSMGGKLKPLAKSDPMCNIMSEQEVTHTPEYVEKTENSDEVEFPIYHSTTSVQNFMTNRL